MGKIKIKEEAEILADTIIEGLQEKKGQGITCLNLKHIHNAVCEYFIICHGDSTTQVSALADAVEEFTWKDLQEKAWHKEGFENAQWILLDFANVVVHIFHKDQRSFYNLEGLWADAEVRHIEQA